MPPRVTLCPLSRPSDVVVHFVNPMIAFGGLGSSGMGALHGKHYFDACSQKRGVMTKGTSGPARLLDLQAMLRAPPYSPLFTAIVKLLVLKLGIPLPPRYPRKAALLLLACLLFGGLRWLVGLAALRGSLRRAALTVAALLEAGPEGAEL